ncbi:extracellular matrix protein FRAS1, partial [Elysia marginata]
NNSVWQPDSCLVCQCKDPVAVCESLSCQDPACQSDMNEELELLPDACCPVCSSPGASCDVSGTIVQHDTVWSTSPCISCRCFDGEVTCDEVTCPATPCQPGQVKQQVDGECCPQCVPTGRRFIDRETRRMLSSVCNTDMSPGRTHVHGMEGEQWSPDVCTFCACHSGQVTCRSITCDVSLECAQGCAPKMALLVTMEISGRRTIASFVSVNTAKLFAAQPSVLK